MASWKGWLSVIVVVAVVMWLIDNSFSPWSAPSVEPAKQSIADEVDEFIANLKR